MNFETKIWKRIKILIKHRANEEGKTMDILPHHSWVVVSSHLVVVFRWYIIEVERKRMEELRSRETIPTQVYKQLCVASVTEGKPWAEPILLPQYLCRISMILWETVLFEAMLWARGWFMSLQICRKEFSTMWNYGRQWLYPSWLLDPFIHVHEWGLTCLLYQKEDWDSKK